MKAETSDIIIFFGRFHPLVLHLPIGFLTLAFLLELLSRFKRFHHFRASVSFVLLLGSATSIVAALLGYLLAQSGGYQEELLSIHQWTGFAVAGFSAIAFVLARLYKRFGSQLADRAYLAAISAAMFSLAVAGHYGGSLTHGSGYLSQYMPDGLRQLTGMSPNEEYQMPVITNLSEAAVYADIIDPIFRANCTSCHNENKSKGDLMMHTPDHLMKGGENGAIVVPGNANESSMIERIMLPESHDDHMPPEGKRQLSDAQISLLVWWVNSGAPFDKKVADVHVPNDVQEILNELAAPDGGKTKAELLLSSAVTPADEQMIFQLRSKGVMIAPLSDGVHWLQADVEPSVNADSLLAAFEGISNQLTWLDLGGSSVTDKGLSALGTFKNLTRLHLGNTKITDQGVEHLKGLTYLESLNLYGTSVTDEGIQSLSGLKNLRTMYLWQTRVSGEAAKRLQQAIPGLEVNFGIEVTSK